MKRMILLGVALFLGHLQSSSAALMVSPMSMEFGGVPVGQVSSQMFWVRNLGPQPERVFSCYAYPPFQCQLNCYGPIYPGQDCMGWIYFMPRNGTYEAQTVIIDTSASTQNIWVRGFGIER